ncbi:hypothetical protein Tco_0535775 [Tanacetum coccineum]
MSMNQKSREEWEKKQADIEKLQRPKGSGYVDDGRGKSSKLERIAHKTLKRAKIRLEVAGDIKGSREFASGSITSTMDATEDHKEEPKEDTDEIIPDIVV